MFRAIPTRLIYSAIGMLLIIALTIATTTATLAASKSTSRSGQYFQRTADMVSVSAKALTDHGCASNEWHFVINQVQPADRAPSIILVQWDNGASESVPVDRVTGKTAHYTTYSNLNANVTSATTEIYAEWGGQFNLSHGPCSVAATSTPTNTPVSTVTSIATNTPTNTPEADTTETVVAGITEVPTGTFTATPRVTGTPPVFGVTEIPTESIEVRETAESTPTLESTVAGVVEIPGNDDEVAAIQELPSTGSPSTSGSSESDKFLFLALIATMMLALGWQMRAYSRGRM